MNTKKHLLLLIAFTSISFLQAQEHTNYTPQPKYPLLFKALIPINQNDPVWIHKMYSTHPNLFEIEKAYIEFYEKHEFEKTLHTQNYKHLMKMIYQNHWYKEDGSIEVKKTVASNQDVNRLQSRMQPTQVASWSPIGPLDTYNNGGIETQSKQVNVFAIAQSISNPLTMLCGTETGAIFKSTDKGENWFSVGDNLFNDGVSSVEIDPTNHTIFFVGTTDRIYRSVDGGVTWTEVLNIPDLNIYEFAIKSTNNQIIFAAGNKGLFKSTNGGTTWTNTYTETCWDIKFKTNDAETIFLLKSNPTLKLTEFYKSNNGGTSFTLKSNGWFTPTSTSSIGGGRIGVTNADANRVYVVMLGNVDNYATDVNFIGVYKSSNAGESWSLPYDQNNDGVPNNNPGGPYSANHWCFSCFENDKGNYDQGFYNLAIDVSDTDPNKFLVGMLNLFKSENGGITYTNWGGYECTGCNSYYRHPDHQDILVHGNDVFVATDGGIDLYDANFNIIKAINKGINGSDNWGFGQGWNEDVLTCGRYHNGNGVYHANYGSGRFISLGGGEAPTGYVNLGDNFKVYHSDLDAYQITSTFSTLNTVTPNLTSFPNEDYFTGKKSEVVYDPINYNHLYIGKENKLLKSENGGTSFNLVKAFGTNTTSITTGIEISRQNPNIIFVAQRDGSLSKLWFSQDKGSNWTQLTLPESEVTMYISLNENNTLFLAYGDGSNSVYKSTNLGNSWSNLTTATIATQNISSAIVQMGTNDGVYITMAGSNNLYYRNATHTDWQLFNQGLPINTRFMGALPFYKDGELRISGTRGFWKTPFFETSTPIAQPMVDKLSGKSCPADTFYFDSYSVLSIAGATFSWSFPGASYISSSAVRNPKVVYTPGTHSVTLTVTNANGTHTKTLANLVTVTAGTNTPTAPTITQSGNVLTSSSTTNNQWCLNGNPIPGATNQNYTATINGDYSVLILKSGCSSVASNVININNTVGVMEANNPNQLSIYPNPSNGNFTLEFNSSEKSNYRIEITNTMGQLVYHEDVNNLTGTYTKLLNIGGISSGIYTVRLSSTQHQTIEKIIIY